MIRRTTYLLAALLAMGCYDSSFEERNPDREHLPPNLQMADLHAYIRTNGHTIKSDIVVKGRVTTSDEERNFYKSFCVEDASGGIEVMAGIDHLHNDYPIGSSVALRLKGVYADYHYGVLQIGRRPVVDGGFATDYLGSSRAAVDKVVERECAVPEETTPLSLSPAELDPKYCGRLVRLHSLVFQPEESASTEEDEQLRWTGYKRFLASDGREIYTYVRPYARFARRLIPTTPRTLTGILQYDEKHGGRYILKIRKEDDCSN